MSCKTRTMLAKNTTKRHGGREIHSVPPKMNGVVDRQSFVRFVSREEIMGNDVPGSPKARFRDQGKNIMINIAKQLNLQNYKINYRPLNFISAGELVLKTGDTEIFFIPKVGILARKVFKDNQLYDVETWVTWDEFANQYNTSLNKIRNLIAQ